MSNATPPSTSDDAQLWERLNVAEAEFDRETSARAASVLFGSGQCPAPHEILHPESLTDAEAALLERHLESCDRCAALMLSTSIDGDEAARVVALAEALAEEAPDASSLHSAGGAARNVQRLIDVAPANPFSFEPPEGEFVTHGRRGPRKSYVDRFAEVGGLAVAASVAILVALSFNRSGMSPFDREESPLMAAADDAIADEIQSFKPVVEPEVDVTGDTFVFADSNDQSPQVEQAADFLKLVDAYRQLRVTRIVSSNLENATILSSDDRRRLSVSLKERDSELERLIRNYSHAWSVDEFYKASAMASLPFENENLSALSSASATDPLRTCISFMLELNEPEIAEKLLLGALDRKPKDDGQAQALVEMFAELYGPDHMDKPHEFEAVYKRLRDANRTKELAYARESEE